ncbi:class I SAM-dependent methyltransferase [Aeromicrobium sp. UC242_57]
MHGVDSSPEMIQRANRDSTDPGAADRLADVATWSPQGTVDLIVSNALFQWVPNQLDVIRRLAAAVSPGGTFALQVPRNVRRRQPHVAARHRS